MVRKKHSGRLVWYMREGMEGRPLTARALKLTAPRCDRAIAISRFVGSDIRRHVSGRLDVRTIPNAVDTHRFRPGRRPPVDLVKKDGEVWFGIIGAVTPLKGQDIFLAAARKVVASIPGARFLVVGSNFYKTEVDSAYVKRLRDFVTSTTLEGRVRFLGHRRDVARLLSVVDIAVQSNRGPEGLGRSVLEAMACAVPVIAVDRWGPAELIRHGETGMLFAHMDVEDLARRMVHLAEDAELRQHIGANARVWVQQHLDGNKIAKAYAAALAQLLPLTDDPSW
jgi:phosphatidylinositol alpha-mannosyltransferase